MEMIKKIMLLVDKREEFISDVFQVLNTYLMVLKLKSIHPPGKRG